MKKWGLIDKVLLWSAIAGSIVLVVIAFSFLSNTLLKESSVDKKEITESKSSTYTNTPVEKAFVTESREDAASLHSSWYMVQSVSLVMQARDYGDKIGLSESEVTAFVTSYPEFSVETYNGNDSIIEYDDYLDREESRWSKYYDEFCISFDKYANSLLN